MQTAFLYDYVQRFVCPHLLDASLFTGKERDTESGLDYFGARYYASNMGRWMSPDWADKPEDLPYANLDNPQSLNLYGYVGNNPLSRVDADGHCCSWDEVKDFSVGALKGTVASLTGGAMGSAPSPYDFSASLNGQLFGTAGVAAHGIITTVEGGIATGGGEVLAPVTGGASLSVSAVGIGAVSLGTAVTAGATANANAIVNAMAMKPGSSGGPGTGKRTTPAQREKILKENSGKCVVSGCNEKATHVDHADPRSRGGDTTKENLQGMCAHHNCQKCAKTSQEYDQWLKQQKK